MNSPADVPAGDRAERAERGPLVVEYHEPPQVAEVTSRMLDADDQQALELERANLAASDNGWQPGDPTEQPYNPEEAHHGEGY